MDTLGPAYIKGDLPGTPKDMGPPIMVVLPYYSHIFRHSYGSHSMGPAYHFRGIF